MHSSAFQSIVEFRRSNRKFDPEVEVPEAVMQRSLERTTLSPNSSNMQLWEFYWLQSESEKNKFHALCLDQSAAKTASWLTTPAPTAKVIFDMSNAMIAGSDFARCNASPMSRIG